MKLYFKMPSSQSKTKWKQMNLNEYPVESINILKYYLLEIHIEISYRGGIHTLKET